ncbi:hypothetical protein BTM25_40540 [Actinomadura rubteroloni]|uniref:Mce-associated membrane protein n=1 Tax=Actinomadura rubteroloni TaxID=1926885 RepID=A0A2P4UK47_9ACTN|nr:hypothetical protein [Actinomadura rubteroloni]POM25410.1 hypothetical protein BTM25_40540 [Actinomadura rubteroloni]
MTTLRRGKRSGKDDEGTAVEETPEETVADETPESARARRAAERAREAARVAELAEEAAERAREAARLAQVAAEAAGRVDEDDPLDDDAPDAADAATADPKAAETAPAVASDDEPAAADAAETGTPDGQAAAATVVETDADEKAEVGVQPAAEADDAKSDEKSAATGVGAKADADPAVETGDAEGKDASAEDETASAPAKVKFEHGKSSVKKTDAAPGFLARVSSWSPQIIAALTVVIVALAVASVVLTMKDRDQKATEQGTRDATVAASRVAQAVSSYDYRTLKDDFKAASQLTTGTLRTQFDKFAQQLTTMATEQQAVSTTTVLKSGALTTGADKVEVLVYANRNTTTKNDKQRRLPEPLRIRITMEKKGGHWLASKLVVL